MYQQEDVTNVNNSTTGYSVYQQPDASTVESNASDPTVSPPLVQYTKQESVKSENLNPQSQPSHYVNYVNSYYQPYMTTSESGSVYPNYSSFYSTPGYTYAQQDPSKQQIYNFSSHYQQVNSYVPDSQYHMYPNSTAQYR